MIIHNGTVIINGDPQFDLSNKLKDGTHADKMLMSLWPASYIIHSDTGAIVCHAALSRAGFKVGGDQCERNIQ